jgi:hypothetical protein
VASEDQRRLFQVQDVKGGYWQTGMRGVEGLRHGCGSIGSELSYYGADNKEAIARRQTPRALIVSKP